MLTWPVLAETADRRTRPYGQLGRKGVCYRSMDRQATTGQTPGDREAQLSNVALLHYVEGLTQGEIAKRMKLSRATIVNMLRESLRLGIVDIRVDGRHLRGSNLARELRDKYDLADVYVAQAASDGSRVSHSETLPHLARVGATALLDAAEPGDRIGVAWGETISAVAEAMPPRSIFGVEICQLVGAIGSEFEPGAETAAAQIARKIAAQCHPLHAPALISSADLAAQLRSEPAIRAQLDRLAALDLTLATIGTLEADARTARAGLASPEELSAARAAGAVAVLCCRYLDRDGAEVAFPPHDRIIAAELSDLKAAGKRLVAVCGVDRCEAVLATLRAGLATHLCVDHGLAVRLADA